MRISDQVVRGAPLTIFVDDAPVAGFAGETVAALMMAAGPCAFRQDSHGQPRGLYCNMGTCCECMVLLGEGERAVSVRACLVPAAEGLRISTASRSK